MRESAAENIAVLLIAHGSRRAAANADLLSLATDVARQGGYTIVETAFLELAEPDIPAGGRRCIARGARRVLMLPYFLSAGVHVSSDLEEHRQTLVAEFPDAEFILCPHLGLHPLMTQIVLDRLQEGGSP